MTFFTEHNFQKLPRLPHVPEVHSISLLSHSPWYECTSVYFNIYVMERYLDCYIFDYMYKSATNVDTQAFWWTWGFISLGCPTVHYDAVQLLHKETIKLFSRVSIPFFIPTSSILKIPVSPHSLPSFGGGNIFFISTIWEVYKWYFMVVLIYISVMVLNIFHMLFSHLCVFMTSSIKFLFTSFVHFLLCVSLPLIWNSS